MDICSGSGRHLVRHNGLLGGGISAQMTLLNEEAHRRWKRQKADTLHLTLGCKEIGSQAPEHFNDDTSKTTETSLKWRSGRNVKLRFKIPVTTLEGKSVVKRVRYRMSVTGVMLEIKYVVGVCRLL